jgi:hypothetical protein
LLNQLSDDRLANNPPHERMVFELKHFQGLSLRTVSEILNTSEKLYKAPEFRHHIYDAALNNFARLSMSPGLASPITK